MRVVCVVFCVCGPPFPSLPAVRGERPSWCLPPPVMSPGNFLSPRKKIFGNAKDVERICTDCAKVFSTPRKISGKICSVAVRRGRRPPVVNTAAGGTNGRTDGPRFLQCLVRLVLSVQCRGAQHPTLTASLVGDCTGTKCRPLRLWRHPRYIRSRSRRRPPTAAAQPGGRWARRARPCWRAARGTPRTRLHALARSGG